MSDNRRDFLKKGALLGLSGLASGLIGNNKLNSIEQVTETLFSEEELFVLPKLPYAYNAMEPFIDAKTMEIHYLKHHQGYVDKLNGAPKSDKKQIDFKVDDAAKCRNIDDKTSTLVRNNLGGHYNHSLFWTLLKSNPEKKPNAPTGKLAEAMTKNFKFFEEFQKEFSDKATKIFGSGWCWLIVDSNGDLKITTTSNQDNPLMKVASEHGTPVLALDVWEHAYYLKYQNRRAEYIQNWWALVNWDKAEQLFTQK